MNLRDLLQIDEKSFLRLAGVLFIFILAIGPGVLLLFLEQITELLSANIFVIIGVSVVLSIPFHLLGALAYLHPYKTLRELATKPDREVVWNLVAGTGLWAMFSAAGLYALVHGGKGWLSDTSADPRIRYLVAYLIIATFFGVLFSINVWRFRNLRRANDR
jgi:hypothetical protein